MIVRIRYERNLMVNLSFVSSNRYYNIQVNKYTVIIFTLPSLAEKRVFAVVGCYFCNNPLLYLRHVTFSSSSVMFLYSVSSSFISLLQFSYFSCQSGGLPWGGPPPLLLICPAASFHP